MPRLLGFLGGCAAVVTAFAQAPTPVVPPSRPIPGVEHVLVISVDGLRPDLALLAEMPTLRTLVRDGSYSFWARTTPLAKTLPSHTSMVTGVAPTKHGIEWNVVLPLATPVYPKVPTMFELAGRAGYDTALVAGKATLGYLNKPGTISHVSIPATGSANNEAVLAEAVNMIGQFQPSLLLVHFPEGDSVGHAKGWGSPEFLAMLATTDRQIAQLLTALDRAGLRRSTVVILTADHGGQMRTHGPDDVRSRYIPWIVAGPGVRPGFDLTLREGLQVAIEDTAATALWLLGVPRPANLDGQPVLAAFTEK